MSRNNRGIRTTVGWAVGLALAAATPWVAYAQEAQDTLEEVIVTGSRIARPELESTTPILALGDEQLRATGLTNIAEIAAQLPQFAPSFGASRTQSTFSGAASSGLNTFNLRNLAPERTLTLINGRRAPGGLTTSTGVDFNMIPTANIERLEVLTGGASAVYGADAVAGVVNLITKKNFEGIEFGANYSEASEGDNKSPGGYILMGGKFGETGRGLLTIEYQKQGEVSCRDRYLCAEDFSWFDPEAAPIRGPGAYSGVAPIAKFQFAGATGPAQPFYTARGGSYTTTPGGSTLIPFVTAIDGYNRNADRTLAIPTKRVMVAGEAEMELPWAGITAFAEFNYGESRTVAPFEGHPFQSTTAGSFFGGAPGATPVQASIPFTNPFIPQAFRTQAAAVPGFNPATGVLNWQQRFNAIADTRGATNDREMYRAVAGVKGSFESIGGFGSDWSWELSHLYGRTTLNSITNGLVGTDRLYYGLRVEQVPGAAPGTYQCTDPGARATGCVPIDPFNPYTQAMKDYLTVSAGQSGRNDLEDTVAVISGSLFDLPAGPFQAVLGVERRSFAGFLDYADQINVGTVTGNVIGDVDRVKTVTKEIFAEVNVPILKDLPFAQELTANGSFRSSDPDRGDKYETWGYGLNWAPVESVRIRASQARAVRTPVPDDLSGTSQTFGTVNDPCAVEQVNDNAIRAANCASEGISPTYNPPQTVRQSVSGFVGGNPDLDPEVADTLTFGIVFTPTFLEGFSISVDRFNIEVEDVINTVGRQLKVDLCYDTTERLFCDDIVRGPNANVAETYTLQAVNDQSINVATMEISGYDVEAGYSFDLGSDGQFGEIDLRALMTFYDKADVTALPGQPVTDYLGYAGGSTSDQGWIKRQGTINVGYKFGPFEGRWNSRYIGRSFMGVGAEEFGEVGSHFYHDVRFAYNFGEGSQVYLGVDNVADKDPPFFASGFSGTQALDTIPAYYDIFGRTYFGGIRLKF